MNTSSRHAPGALRRAVALDTAEIKKLPAQEGKMLSAPIRDRKIVVE